MGLFQIVAATRPAAARAASSSPSSPREERVGRGPRRGETNKNAPPLPTPLLHPMEEREKSRSLMQPCRNAHAKPSLIPAGEIRALEDAWRNDPRWRGVIRNYVPEQVLRLRGTLKIEHTIADRMSRKLWRLLNQQPYLNALGAVTGNQAVQMAQAGLKAIYLSGWQVAADNNLAPGMYPDQSLYPSNSVPMAVHRINKALQRADQIQSLNGGERFDFWTPIVADAEAGFGGPLNAHELMLQMIEEGAAGVHFEDQLASAKKCGHMGGKVLVPAFEFIHKLTAARLAAD